LRSAEPQASAGTSLGDEHLAFATADPHEAHDRAQRLMAAHRMRIVDRDPPFAARVHHAPLGGVSLLSFAYGAGVEVASEPLEQFATVHLPLRGSVELEHLGRRTVADARRGAVFSPEGRLWMRWSPGLELLVVRVTRAALEARLRALLDRPLRAPLRFDPALDPAGGGRAVAGAVAMLQHAVRATGTAGASPMLGAELEHAVVSALLLGQPHNYTAALMAWPSAAPPRVVRAALDHADAEPDRLPTLADMAAHAGVSERTLHAAFRSRFGEAPLAHVRRVRLERVRAELLDLGAEDGATVAQVALRHGFAHPGRFAAAYRRRFGEAPSATLRR